MRRQILGGLAISGLVLMVLWAATAVALRLHIVESALLSDAVLFITGVACVFGLLLYCWHGIRWLQSEWNARV